MQDYYHQILIIHFQRIDTVSWDKHAIYKTPTSLQRLSFPLWGTIWDPA